MPDWRYPTACTAPRRRCLPFPLRTTNAFPHYIALLTRRFLMPRLFLHVCLYYPRYCSLPQCSGDVLPTLRKSLYYYYPVTSPFRDPTLFPLPRLCGHYRMVCTSVHVITGGLVRLPNPLLPGVTLCSPLITDCHQWWTNTLHHCGDDHNLLPHHTAPPLRYFPHTHRCCYITYILFTWPSPCPFTTFPTLPCDSPPALPDWLVYCADQFGTGLLPCTLPVRTMTTYTPPRSPPLLITIPCSSAAALPLLLFWCCRILLR